MWEEALLNLCKGLNFPHIDVKVLVDRMLPEEISKNTKELTPYICIVILLVACCSTLLATTTDCVRSKPSVGFMAVVSVVMATGSAFGFLAHCGVPLIFFEFFIPLLTLGERRRCIKNLTKV